MCRRLKRATGRCGRSPTRVPRGWRRGWEKSRLPAAIRTPSPASGIRSRKCGAWIWYGLGLMLLAYGGPQRFSAIGAAASAAVLGIFVFKALKRLSQRPRPCQIEPHCWSKVLPPDKFSFPSGHTMTAFSIALVLSYFYRGAGVPVYFFACSIAVSRIVLGMHFLSDVLAGAILGVGLGCCALTAFAAMGVI